MEFTIKSGNPTKLATGALIVPCFVDTPEKDDAFTAVNQASEGRLTALIQRGDLDERAGSLMVVPDLPGSKAERVVIVSLGKADDFGDKAWRNAVAAVAKWLANGPASQAAVSLAGILPPNRDSAWAMQQGARILRDATYRYATTLSAASKDKRKGANTVALLTSGSATAALKTAVARGSAIAEGMALTRELGNLPANHCTPTYLADTAQKLGQEFKFKVEVLERKDMEKLGMGAVLAVAKGSHQPPKFIVMHYQGGKSKDKPVVLVGKGITFDTGGISLKPASEMDEMKYDMCGAASVVGTFKALARMELPINVVGIIPATENMPGGNATKPGDVVTSMSGQSIEILNTDAEGRLVLCDALTYAERFKPACVIDVATLTGAVIVALGKIPSGLMANDDELADELLALGQQSGDRAWRLPIWEDYQDQLKSNFADMGNIGGRSAGSITAACFLARYTKEYKWAHLDIAGTAWVSGEAKGATGRPVPLLSEFLIGRAKG